MAGNGRSLLLVIYLCWHMLWRGGPIIQQEPLGF